MSFTPFRQRIRDRSPGFLREGSSERVMYCFGAMVDARTEKVNQGVKAHLPVLRNPNDRTKTLWVPPADCLDEIGRGLGILRGLSEADLSYGSRLRAALDAYRFGGTARGVLSQVLGYLLALTPAVRMVATRYDPATYPPTRVSSTWDSYPAGRSLSAEPVTVYAAAGGNGDWNWDSLSQVTGSWGHWGAWLIVYSVAPNDWTAPAQAWGYGSVYTGSGDYSTVTSAAYVATGGYTGSTQAWGAGSTYTGSGDYSTVTVGAYAGTGSYSGASQAWGLSVTTDVVQSIAIIAKQFKNAFAWVRSIIVCFNAAEFDPSQPAGGGINPDGTWGTWSKITSGAYAESRFTDSVYGGEVI